MSLVTVEKAKKALHDALCEREVECPSRVIDEWFGEWINLIYGQKSIHAHEGELIEGEKLDAARRDLKQKIYDGVFSKSLFEEEADFDMNKRTVRFTLLLLAEPGTVKTKLIKKL